MKWQFNNSNNVNFDNIVNQLCALLKQGQSFDENIRILQSTKNCIEKLIDSETSEKIRNQLTKQKNQFTKLDIKNHNSNQTVKFVDSVGCGLEQGLEILGSDNRKLKINFKLKLNEKLSKIEQLIQNEQKKFNNKVTFFTEMGCLSPPPTVRKVPLNMELICHKLNFSKKIGAVNDKRIKDFIEIFADSEDTKILVSNDTNVSDNVEEEKKELEKIKAIKKKLSQNQTDININSDETQAKIGGNKNLQTLQLVVPKYSSNNKRKRFNPLNNLSCNFKKQKNHNLSNLKNNKENSILKAVGSRKNVLKKFVNKNNDCRNSTKILDNHTGNRKQSTHSTIQQFNKDPIGRCFSSRNLFFKEPELQTKETEHNQTEKNQPENNENNDNSNNNNNCDGNNPGC